MAWESRKNGGRYYTRSSRVNGRVVREYIGAGDMAEACAALDGLVRQWQELDRAEFKAIRSELAVIEAAVSEYDEQVTAAVSTVLTAAGYHRHDRGAWRKKKEIMTQKQIEAPRELAPAPPPFVYRGDEISAGLKAEPGSAAQIQAIACVNEYRRELKLDSYANFSKPIQDLLMSSADIVGRLAWQQLFDHSCMVIAGPNATPLEKLVVERILISQNQLNHCEARYSNKMKDGMSPELGMHYQKCIGMAQTRYLAAIKALAQIRKLQLPPTLQVNIGEKQVNVATGESAQNTQPWPPDKPPFEIG